MALKSSKRNTKNSETSAVRERAIAAPGVLFEEVAPCRRAARVSFRYLRLASWVESHADHMKDKSERTIAPHRFGTISQLSRRFGRIAQFAPLTELASAGIVAYFLFRAARELSRRGERAFSAFLTLLTVFAKTVPPILIAGLAAAAGAWVVNHVQM